MRVDPEDHQGPGDDRHLADRQGAGQGGRVGRRTRTQITDVLTALASASTLDHPLLIERTRSEAGRHPADHRRPRAVRRIQRRRHPGGRGTRCAAPLAGQGAGAVRHRSQGGGLLHVPAPSGGRRLDRLLRAAAPTPTPRPPRSAMLEAFLVGLGRRDLRRPDPVIDELHVVSTHFVSMISQLPRAVGSPRWRSSTSAADAARVARLLPSYEFEPGSRVAAGRAAAEVRQHPDLRGSAGLRGERVGGPAGGLQGGHGQRQRHHQHPEPAGEPGPPGPDHPGTGRDRRRRRRARRIRRRRGLIAMSTATADAPAAQDHDHRRAGWSGSSARSWTSSSRAGSVPRTVQRSARRGHRAAPMSAR